MFIHYHLQRVDNLSTVDKQAGPSVSFIRRFHCISEMSYLVVRVQEGHMHFSSCNCWTGDQHILGQVAFGQKWSTNKIICTTATTRVSIPNLKLALKSRNPCIIVHFFHIFYFFSQLVSRNGGVSTCEVVTESIMNEGILDLKQEQRHTYLIYCTCM